MSEQQFFAGRKLLLFGVEYEPGATIASAVVARIPRVGGWIERKMLTTAFPYEPQKTVRFRPRPLLPCNTPDERVLARVELARVDAEIAALGAEAPIDLVNHAAGYRFLLTQAARHTPHEDREQRNGITVAELELRDAVALASRPASAAFDAQFAAMLAEDEAAEAAAKAEAALQDEQASVVVPEASGASSPAPAPAIAPTAPRGPSASNPGKASHKRKTPPPQ